MYFMSIDLDCVSEHFVSRRPLLGLTVAYFRMVAFIVVLRLVLPIAAGRLARYNELLGVCWWFC